MGEQAHDQRPQDSAEDLSHRQYLLALSRMTPAQRVEQAMELSDNVRRIFKDGLRNRFPSLSDAELHPLYLERLALCHNRNY
jgi:hypothetical protein